MAAGCHLAFAATTRATVCAIFGVLAKSHCIWSFIYVDMSPLNRV
jgi:hypothetical protein